jgi:hypothetical protein
MKKFMLLLIAIQFVIQCFSQNTNLDYKKAIKIYNLTSYEKYSKSENIDDSSSSAYILSTVSDLQILHPTVGYQWKTKNNNFQEIEISYLMLGKKSTISELKEDPIYGQQVLNGSNILSMHISAQYEFILNFNKLKDTKFIPALGFAVNPYYKQNNYTPKTPTSFPESEITVGTKVFITPRLNYHINSKFYLDVNIPFCVFDTYFLSKKTGNSFIPISERNVKSFNFQQFPFIVNGRIGVGYKF